MAASDMDEGRGQFRHEEGVGVEVGVLGPALGLGLRAPLASWSSTTRWRSSSNTSLARFRNSAPKMYSLNSEASILPRKMSTAANRCRSSCGSVSTPAG